MKTGLVLGKFMPVHNGHLALIRFALQHCDQLLVLLCHHPGEPISGAQRLQWLHEIFDGQDRISVFSYHYNPQQLTDGSDSNPDYAKGWADAIKNFLPPIHVFFSSENYGNAFAAHLNVEHILFDEARSTIPVSGSKIRQRPITYWSYLPATVQPFFVQKIALVGSESTGKSTLAERLANHYRTTFVPELAREVIGHTNECTEQDLLTIATLQAKAILDKTKLANKFLFSDTELTITKSYSLFLFGKALQVPEWVENVNQFQLYLFLETDCPYVQDGTRLSESERKALSRSHKDELGKKAIARKTVRGSWEERFSQACKEIDDLISRL